MIYKHAFKTYIAQLTIYCSNVTPVENKTHEHMNSFQIHLINMSISKMKIVH